MDGWLSWPSLFLIASVEVVTPLIWSLGHVWQRMFWGNNDLHLIFITLKEYPNLSNNTSTKWRTRLAFEIISPKCTFLLKGQSGDLF